MKKLILASASPRRRELLSQAGIEYQVCASDREERSSERKPEQLVMDLAGQKAADVYEKLGSDKEQWILGADTVVSLDGEGVLKWHGKYLEKVASGTIKY